MGAKRTVRIGSRSVAVIACVALAAAVVAMLVRDARESAGAGPAPPCPEAFFDQPARAERLRGLLGSTEDGRALLDALGESEVRFCFGTIEVPVVTSERVLLLDTRAADPESAARAGHLLQHVVRGAPMPAEIAPGVDCDAVVLAALEREAAAYALEIRLRRALGVHERRYAFEDAYAEAGEHAILDYLVEHPEGGPGMDGLGAAYRQRCELGRAAPRR